MATGIFVRLGEQRFLNHLEVIENFLQKHFSEASLLQEKKKVHNFHAFSEGSTLKPAGVRKLREYLERRMATNSPNPQEGESRSQHRCKISLM